ncbi:MAG: monofunctional biosynthetic peptidoglycan transglycosylase [Bacteroidia bacterium]|nr:monofunctional biosynthetic peptidoglycan transglycosylase [Bacteroidia bacterium]MCZ2276571.1 monofunctional biosynthetic peptidoglycan transglycosylase [Bacteroidia bacterium]
MKKILRKTVKIILKAFGWFFLVSVASVILFRFIPVPFTPLMVIRLYQQAVDPDIKMRCTKSWKSLDKISVNIQKAFVAAEDQKFFEHFGFDREAINKAMKYNEKHKGRRVKGASTITQQTAKNLFLWPSRNWVRKGLEVYFTFLIETFWSKKRILEVYMNIIETGKGIYGVEAASIEYFKKPALKINASQAALLAACNPNPRRWSPTHPTPYIKRKQAWILRQMFHIDWPVDNQEKNIQKPKAKPALIIGF